jgi:ketosteroid isomerase-like protein
MRRIVVAALVLAAVPFVSQRMSAQSADPGTLLPQRYSDWMTAFRKGDGASMDKMEADGLMLIFQEGDIWSKQKPRVEELKGRGPIPYTHVLEQVRARVDGNVAVLTGIQVDTNTKDNSKGRSSFTSVWKREGGEWKIWSAHWSLIPDKK